MTQQRLFPREKPTVLGIRILTSWLLNALSFAFLLPGCGSGVGATVTGLLTIDGKPAPEGIRIDYQPEGENASSSTGFTDARGEYEMMFNVHKVGVMPGECLIRVSVLEGDIDGPGVALPEGLKALKNVRIPDSFGRKSTLRQTVKPGRNRIDIVIETDATTGKGAR
jgi:hypothetical protein